MTTTTAKKKNMYPILLKKDKKEKNDIFFFFPLLLLYIFFFLSKNENIWRRNWLQTVIYLFIHLFIYFFSNFSSSFFQKNSNPSEDVKCEFFSKIFRTAEDNRSKNFRHQKLLRLLKRNQLMCLKNHWLSVLSISAKIFFFFSSLLTIIDSFIYSNDQSVKSFIQSFNHSIIQSFIHSFILSSNYSIIHSFIYSFIN